MELKDSHYWRHQEDPSMLFNYRCDESKCVSRGMSDIKNRSFTCYGDDGTFYPMMCADGYLPKVVEDEPARFGGDVDGSRGAMLSYFTCCPPHSIFPEAIHAIRECSDPIAVPEADNDQSIDTLCDDQDTRIFSRRMKSNAQESNIESFICCDSILNADDDYFENYKNNSTTTTNFLNDAECVPYRNEFYEASKVQNQYGMISVVSCDFAGPVFQFPRPVGDGAINDITSTGVYQCCKHGPALPPYVQDFTFNITLYPLIVSACVAAIASGIIAVATVIPLLIQLKDGSYQKAQRSTFLRARVTTTSLHTSSTLQVQRNSTSRGGFNSQISTPSNEGENVTVVSDLRTSQRQFRCYSTYNLYLVYLTFADFVYLLFTSGFYWKTANQKFNPGFYSVIVAPSNVANVLFSLEWSVVIAYVSINLYINAIVTYEVMLFLNLSRTGRRIRQPSLTRVNTQVGIVYFVSIIFGLADYFVRDAAWKAHDNNHVEKCMTLLWLMAIWNNLITIPSIGYVVYASILAWWKGYTSNANGCSANAKAMKELAIYFFRIIAVFLGFWVPAISASLYSLFFGQTWGYPLGVISFSCQAILTASMILTKSDVRKYVFDLVTLSYFSGSCRNQKTRESRNEALSIAQSKSQESWA